MSDNWAKKFQNTFEVHAVVIRGDEILSTYHDQGMGVVLALPANYIYGDALPRSVVEQAVLQQTSLEVSAGRLLCIDHNVCHWFRFEKYERTEICIDMAFLCTLKQDGEPRIPDDANLDSIFKVGWVKISDFVSDLPSKAQEFWQRAIHAAQGNGPVDLVEHAPHDIYI